MKINKVLKHIRFITKCNCPYILRVVIDKNKKVFIIGKTV